MTMNNYNNINNTHNQNTNSNDYNNDNFKSIGERMNKASSVLIR